MAEPEGDQGPAPTARRTWSERSAEAGGQHRVRLGVSRRTLGWLLGAVVVGAPLGIVVFWLGASRGLDAWRTSELIAISASVLAFIAAIYALFRAWFLDDGRLLAVLVGVVIGASVGSSFGYRVIPGDTTDGVAVLVTVDGDFESSTGATCRWTDGRVVEVWTRGLVSWSPAPDPRAASLRADLVAATVDVSTAPIGQDPMFIETVAGTVLAAGTRAEGSITFGPALSWRCPASP
jgi:hypothetical protein